MAKKINFSSAIASVFEDVDTFMSFSQLMVDAARGEVAQYTKEEANAAIKEKMFAILGVDEDSNRKTLRKAIRKHKNEVFEVIEETLENLLVSGWGENPFFDEFVEIRNLSEGDTNTFYSVDDTILSVSEVSGGHHDIIRQKIGNGESFSVKTSWYAVKF